MSKRDINDDNARSIRQRPSIEEDIYCPAPPLLRRNNNTPRISIDQIIMDSKIIPTCLGNGKIAVSIQLPDYSKDIEESQLNKIIEIIKEAAKSEKLKDI